MSHRVYILLPDHSRAASTRKFIGCLKIQTYPHFHLALTDDGSTDGAEDGSD